MIEWYVFTSYMNAFRKSYLILNASLKVFKCPANETNDPMPLASVSIYTNIIHSIKCIVLISYMYALVFAPTQNKKKLFDKSIFTSVCVFFYTLKLLHQIPYSLSAVFVGRLWIVRCVCLILLSSKMNWRVYHSNFHSIYRWNQSTT